MRPEPIRQTPDTATAAVPLPFVYALADPLALAEPISDQPAKERRGGLAANHFEVSKNRHAHEDGSAKRNAKPKGLPLK